MSLVYKRILIFFSIALNIGFITMAGFHAYDRSIPKDERRWAELMTIVRELNLPREQVSEVTGMMADFREELDGIQTAVKAARMKAMDLLAEPGELDRERFKGLNQASDTLSHKKQQLFRAHVLEMRTLLGNEKGAEFFSRLRDHILSKRSSSH